MAARGGSSEVRQAAGSGQACSHAEGAPCESEEEAEHTHRQPEHRLAAAPAAAAAGGGVGYQRWSRDESIDLVRLVSGVRHLGHNLEAALRDGGGYYYYRGDRFPGTLKPDR